MYKTNDGFYKVAQTGGTFVVATFFNPISGEVRTKCVRDYDYSDGSRDDDELYNMPIVDDVVIDWKHRNGIILVGDNAKVVKGRKMPIGYVGKVVGFCDYKDRYGRVQTTYVVFKDGNRTSVDNCVLV